MRTLHLFTHSFPTQMHPFDGTFVRDHALFLKDSFKTELTVLQPVQLPFSKKWHTHRSALNLITDIPTHRVSYLSYPGRRWATSIRRNLWKSIKKTLSPEADRILHLHFLYPSGLIIPFLKSSFKSPVFLTIHGEDWYQLKEKPELLRLARESLLAADRIITVGPLLKMSLLEFFPELEAKTRVVPNAIDTSIFKPVSREVSLQLRDKLDMEKERIHVLSVANLRKKKGTDNLLKAWEGATFNTPATLHLIGRPDDSEMLSLVRSAENNGNKAIVYHGPLPRDLIKEYYQAADMFILPSRNEPFGISLIEAISCGLPSISTKSGGPEMIMTDKTGVLCDVDNVHQLRSAMEMMGKNADQYDPSEMHRYIQNAFSAEAYRSRYIQLYNEL